MASDLDDASREARRIQAQADLLVPAIRNELRNANLSPAEAIGWLLAIAAQVDPSGGSVAKPSAFQLPELPSGMLDTAQIVFLGNNPGLLRNEKLPSAGWPASRYESWYRHRFMPGSKKTNAKWYCQHIEPWLPEGYSLDMTAFLDIVPWKWPSGWQVPPKVLHDYAKVHVESALSTAARMRVLVALGRPAVEVLVACGHTTGNVDLADPKPVASKKRESLTIVLAYHPTSHGNRGGSRQYGNKVRACLSSCLRGGTMVGGSNQPK